MYRTPIWKRRVHCRLVHGRCMTHFRQFYCSTFVCNASCNVVLHTVHFISCLQHVNCYTLLLFQLFRNERYIDRWKKKKFEQQVPCSRRGEHEHGVFFQQKRYLWSMSTLISIRTTVVKHPRKPIYRRHVSIHTARTLLHLEPSIFTRKTVFLQQFRNYVRSSVK